MWKDELHHLIAGFNHPGWGLSHSLRIYRMALRLSAERGTGVDSDVLLAAAYLHDMGALGSYRDPDLDHAVRSVALLDTLLPADFPVASRPLLEAIIVGHPYQQMPLGPEEVLVFHDADVLDFMGTVGIARLLAVAGIESWWIPDAARALAVIERFAQQLPAALVTCEAQRIGELRQAEMFSFLGQLREETEGLGLL